MAVVVLLHAVRVDAAAATIIDGGLAL